jgi:hypothetical protein
MLFSYEICTTRFLQDYFLYDRNPMNQTKSTGKFPEDLDPPQTLLKSYE